MYMLKLSAFCSISGSAMLGKEKTKIPVILVPGLGNVSIVLLFRIFAILFLASFFLIQCRQYIRIVLLAMRLPGPPAYPIIGNSHLIFNHKLLFKMGVELRKKYGPIVRGWLSIFPVILIIEPRHIQKVLTSGKHIEKIGVYQWLESFLGKGLVTSGGEVWKRHRRMIQPAFGLDALDEIVPQFERGAKFLVESIKKATENGNNLININPLINECVFNILNEIVFGIKEKSEVNIDGPTAAYRKGKSMLQARLNRPWLMLEPFYRMSKIGQRDAKQKVLLNQCTHKLLAERQRCLADGEKARCFLDFLIGLGFSNDECISEVSTFMLAGQDTVAGAMSFTLYLLAKHPEEQAKAVKEVDEFYKNGLRFGRGKLIYLEQCIKEALRLYPSVFVIGRQLCDDLELDGHIVPSGTDILICPFATHRLPEYFPDPEKFDPERFNSNNIADRDPCAYIPFSAGPRNCVGNKFAMMELSVIVGAILHNFHLSLMPGKEALSLKYRVTIRSAGGVWISFGKRFPS